MNQSIFNRKISNIDTSDRTGPSSKSWEWWRALGGTIRQITFLQLIVNCKTLSKEYFWQKSFLNRIWMNKHSFIVESSQKNGFISFGKDTSYPNNQKGSLQTTTRLESSRWVPFPFSLFYLWGLSFVYSNDHTCIKPWYTILLSQ